MNIYTVAVFGISSVTLVIIAIIFIKFNGKGKVDLKNQVLEFEGKKRRIVNSRKLPDNKNFLISRQLYPHIIDEVKNSSLGLKELEKEIKNEQLKYAERELKVLEGDLYRQTLRNLCIKENSKEDVYFKQFFELNYFLLLKEVQTLIEFNHFLEIENQSIYTIETSDYILEVLNYYTPKIFKPELTGCTQVEYKNSMESYFKTKHGKVIKHILNKLIDIINSDNYQEKYNHLYLKIKAIKNCGLD